MKINILLNLKKIIFINILISKNHPVYFISIFQKIIKQFKDSIFNLSKCILSSFSIIIFKNNSLVAFYLFDILEAFYIIVTKFNKKFGIILVVIIDNANKLAKKLLNML